MHLYVFKAVLDEQGEESFDSYSLPVAGYYPSQCVQIYTVPNVRSAAVLY